MIRASIYTLCLICAMSLQASSAAAQPDIQSRLRVAVIGFTQPAMSRDVFGARLLETSLQDALGRDAQVSMIESSQTQPALAGIKYDGSLNMSKDEARRLGAAIGCDFFVTGKAEVFTLSEREREEHEEAILGVMMVDSRTGALAVFEFLNYKAATKEAALSGLVKMLEARAASYVERMRQFRSVRESLRPVARQPIIISSNADEMARSSTTAEKHHPIAKMEPAAAVSRLANNRSANSFDYEKVEDMPDVESAQGASFKPPEFLSRVKPQYTEEAGKADITATVEALAVFRANGEVGEIEITRWAGFGLDEAAERAIRQLKFKPATRNGQAVSVRAGV